MGLVREDRFANALEAAGLDQTALAKRVGCTPSAINQIVRGSTLRSRFLPDIADTLGVSMQWLRGETDERRPHAHQPNEGARPHQKPELEDAVLIPQVDVSFAMGAGSVNPDIPVVQMVPMSRAWLATLTSSAPADLMVARGDGDSMMPTILDQDYVIIDKGQQKLERQDRIWALVYGGGGMLKRVRRLPTGKLQINSDNVNVTPIEADVDEVTPIGRVVGIVRKV